MLRSLSRTVDHMHKFWAEEMDMRCDLLANLASRVRTVSCKHATSRQPVHPL
jgi:hypothetical protein